MPKPKRRPRRKIVSVRKTLQKGRFMCSGGERGKHIGKYSPKESDGRTGIGTTFPFHKEVTRTYTHNIRETDRKPKIKRMK
jgi:hypothetical protein